jgi:hypothetical protein
MSERFDKKRAQDILTAAAVLGDKAAAKKYKVSLRTLYRYRAKLADDSDVAAAVTAEKEAIRPVLRNVIADALNETIGLGVSLARKSDNLYHVAGFAKILSDALNADTVIEKGLGSEDDGGLGQPGARAPGTSSALEEAPRRALGLLSGGRGKAP